MQKIIEKQDELIKHYEEFVRVLSVSAILKHGEEAKEFVEIRNVLMKQLSALKAQEQVIDTTINPTNLPDHKDSKTAQAQSVEREELDKGWKELENSGLDKPFIPIHPTSEVKEVSAEDILEWFDAEFGIHPTTSNKYRKQGVNWLLRKGAVIIHPDELEQYHKQQMREVMFGLFKHYTKKYEMTFTDKFIFDMIDEYLKDK